MKTLSFYTAYPIIENLYGIKMDQNDFVTTGMIAYNKIGNKNTEIKGEVLDIKNYQAKVPCDALSIEAVFADFPDLVQTSNKSRFPQIPSSYIERYINYWKYNQSLLYDDGKLIKYTLSGDTLYFDHNYKNILILYRAEITDSDGLPYISEKEAEAIAAYCAYTYLFKQAIALRDQGAAQLSQQIKLDWGRLCDLARTPEKLSQNDADKILDAMVSWDRKMYGKSYKPVR